MRFSFEISHVPGKSLAVADALSRAPSSDSTADDHLLQEGADAYIQTTLQSLPATEGRLEESQQQDEVCQKVVEYCKIGWPDRSRWSGVIKKFYPVSSALRPQVLKQLHEGHQGIKKCRERAKQAVWWPGLSKQIKELVRDCSVCYKHEVKRAEPLMPTSLPDLFTLD